MTCYNLSGDMMTSYRMLIFQNQKEAVTLLHLTYWRIQWVSHWRAENIGLKENPKFSNVGDYWDEETMAKITDLLHEFQDLFLTWFSEMKGILGDLGEMKILVETRCKTYVTEAISIETMIQGPCEGWDRPDAGCWDHRSYRRIRVDKPYGGLG